MVRPGVVPYSTVDFRVWIASPLGPELPYRPAFSMLGVEELDESIGWVSVGAFRVGGRGARGGNN